MARRAKRRSNVRGLSAAPAADRTAGAEPGRGLVLLWAGVLAAVVILSLRAARTRRPAALPARPRRRRRTAVAIVFVLVLLAWAAALILAVRRLPSAPLSRGPVLGMTAEARDTGAAAGAEPAPYPPRPVPRVGEESALARGYVSEVYFPPESAALPEPARRLLDGLLVLLRRHPGYRLSIEGHCALFGTAQGRAALSLRRARVVEGYLYRGGWAPETSPRVAGAGGSRPVTRDPAAQHLNRRVEVSVAAD